MANEVAGLEILQPNPSSGGGDHSEPASVASKAYRRPSCLVVGDGISLKAEAEIEIHDAREDMEGTSVSVLDE